jgi:hypothetical protein
MAVPTLDSQTSVLSSQRVFGWVIEYCFLKTGSKYRTNVPKGGIPVSRLQKAALMVKGRITGVREDGSATHVKTPGFMVRGVKNLVVPEGESIFTAEEDSYWWCLKLDSNPDGIPETDTFYITAGDDRELPIGSRLILCLGELSIEDKIFQAKDDPETPLPVGIRIKTGPKTVKAITDCFGYLVDSEKE